MARRPRFSCLLSFVFSLVSVCLIFLSPLRHHKHDHQHHHLSSSVPSTSVIFAYGAEDVPTDSTVEQPEEDGERVMSELKTMLGMDEAEMKERLSAIFPLIDSNGDNELDEEELTSWLSKMKEAVSHKRMVLEMESIDKDGDKKVTFLEMQAAYAESDESVDEKSIADLRKRFNTVDKDNDGALCLEEVGILMNPGRDKELMKLEIDEILAAQDKDGDRMISLEEFLMTGDEEMTEEDKAQFSAEFSSYDTDQNGFIDEYEIEKVVSEPHLEEVKESVAELRKLSPEGNISKQYFEEKFHKFVISSLTDNGEVLRFPADYNLGIPLGNIQKEEEEAEEIHDEL